MAGDADFPDTSGGQAPWPCRGRPVARIAGGLAVTPSVPPNTDTSSLPALSRCQAPGHGPLRRARRGLDDGSKGLDRVLKWDPGVERDRVFDPADAPTVHQVVPELATEEEGRREVQSARVTLPAPRPE